jgi:hypothetical protein
MRGGVSALAFAFESEYLGRRPSTSTFEWMAGQRVTGARDLAGFPFARVREIV